MSTREVGLHLHCIELMIQQHVASYAHTIAEDAAITFSASAKQSDHHTTDNTKHTARRVCTNRIVYING